MRERGRSPGAPVREEIALSWKRSRMCGLDPGVRIADRTAAGADARVPGGRLLRAAEPVLDELFRHAEGTGVSLILGDRDCRIIDRRFDTGRMRSGLERRGVIPGVRYSEETIGTNALGTALETGRGVLINGTEHFAESLKGFSCYGRPIRHPITRRVEGVLDITGIAAVANPLFIPLVTRAVEDIEGRLLHGSRTSDMRLVAAFQQECSRAGAVAVTALGEDLALSNPVALELLEARDRAVLRGVAHGLDAGRTATVAVELASGLPVAVTMTRVEGAGSGTVFTVRDEPGGGSGGAGSGVRAGPGRSVRGPVDESTVGAHRHRAVAVLGEPGSGLSSTASDIAGGGQAAVFDASEVDSEGPYRWRRRLESALRGGVADAPDGASETTVIVDRADLLPDALIRHLVRAVSAAVREPSGGGAPPRVIVTLHGDTAEWVNSASADSAPGGLPDARGAVRGAGALAELVALCTRRVLVPPLRERTAEFPSITERMLSDLAPETAVHLSPGALEMLMAQPWPGNLVELRWVLGQVMQRRSAGPATPEDLPPAYRVSARVSRLTVIERAERNAIAIALAAEGGNKRAAARRLGISRTTLYSRIRAFDL